MAQFKGFISKFFAHQSHEAGQGLVEYALVLVLVSVVTVGVMGATGNSVANVFCTIKTKLDATATEGCVPASQPDTGAPAPSATPHCDTQTSTFSSNSALAANQNGTVKRLSAYAGYGSQATFGATTYAYNWTATIQYDDDYDTIVPIGSGSSGQSFSFTPDKPGTINLNIQTGSHTTPWSISGSYDHPVNCSG